MQDFKYDVAFSFLGRDEPLARKLNDILSDRLKTFIYSDADRQVKLLAGRDGEEAFARVFGAEARTVVVLYRTEWGEQGFTAVESTGIRNRAMDEGYDFTTFIPLDNPPVAPRWLPRARLWFGLEKYGLDAAAAVIESRVQEAGGSPEPETPETVLAVARRRREFEATREAFLNSDAGAAALPVQFSAVLEEFSRVATIEPALLKVSPNPRNPYQFAIFAGPVRMILGLSRYASNSAHGSTLHATEWDSEWWGWHWGDTGQMRERTVFSLDMNNAGAVGWRVKEGDAPAFLSSVDLATWALKRLIARSDLLRAADRERREER